MGSYTGIEENHFSSLHKQQQQNTGNNPFLGSNSSRKRREGSDHQFNATFFPSVAQSGAPNLNLRKINANSSQQHAGALQI